MVAKPVIRAALCIGMKMGRRILEYFGFSIEKQVTFDYNIVNYTNKGDIWNDSNKGHNNR